MMGGIATPRAILIGLSDGYWLAPRGGCAATFVCLLRRPILLSAADNLLVSLVVSLVVSTHLLVSLAILAFDYYCWRRP